MKPLEDVFIKNKMEYEGWIESADDYRQLKKSLVKRGYTNLPISPEPLVRLVGKSKKIRGYGFEAPKTMTRKTKLS